MTRRDIALFTEISGDRNPLHYDDELATASRFGGIFQQVRQDAVFNRKRVAVCQRIRQRATRVECSLRVRVVDLLH